MAGNIFYVSLIITLVFEITLASGLLDDTSNSDVNVVKIRLSEEKSKRLLMQNDVESLMLRMEEMERTIKGKLKRILILDKVENGLIYEPRHEKTGLPGVRPVKTQTGLISFRS